MAARWFSNPVLEKRGGRNVRGLTTQQTPSNVTNNKLEYEKGRREKDTKSIMKRGWIN